MQIGVASSEDIQKWSKRVYRSGTFDGPEQGLDGGTAGTPAARSLSNRSRSSENLIEIGEVKRSDTINYRTFKPEKDGLFCERIFGPVNDWMCSCGQWTGLRPLFTPSSQPSMREGFANSGKPSSLRPPGRQDPLAGAKGRDGVSPPEQYGSPQLENGKSSFILDFLPRISFGDGLRPFPRQTKFVNTLRQGSSQEVQNLRSWTSFAGGTTGSKICSNCHVEITLARIRRYRMGCIELASAVTHVWFLNSRPNLFSLLLKMPTKYVKKLNFYKGYTASDPQLFTPCIGPGGDFFDVEWEFLHRWFGSALKKKPGGEQAFDLFSKRVDGLSELRADPEACTKGPYVLGVPGQPFSSFRIDAAKTKSEARTGEFLRLREGARLRRVGIEQESAQTKVLLNFFSSVKDNRSPFKTGRDGRTRRSTESGSVAWLNTSTFLFNPNAKKAASKVKVRGAWRTTEGRSQLRPLLQPFTLGSTRLPVQSDDIPGKFGLKGKESGEAGTLPIKRNEVRLRKKGSPFFFLLQHIHKKGPKDGTDSAETNGLSPLQSPSLGTSPKASGTLGFAYEIGSGLPEPKPLAYPDDRTPGTLKPFYEVFSGHRPLRQEEVLNALRSDKSVKGRFDEGYSSEKKGRPKEFPMSEKRKPAGKFSETKHEPLGVNLVANTKRSSVFFSHARHFTQNQASNQRPLDSDETPFFLEEAQVPKASGTLGLAYEISSGLPEPKPLAYPDDPKRKKVDPPLRLGLVDSILPRWLKQRFTYEYNRNQVTQIEKGAGTLRRMKPTQTAIQTMQLQKAFPEYPHWLENTGADAFQNFFQYRHWENEGMKLQSAIRKSPNLSLPIFADLKFRSFDSEKTSDQTKKNHLKRGDRPLFEMNPSKFTKKLLLHLPFLLKRRKKRVRKLKLLTTLRTAGFFDTGVQKGLRAEPGTSPTKQPAEPRSTDDLKGQEEPRALLPFLFRTLPVLPPELRPIVQLNAGQLASSDVNDLYRRVISRNNRLKYYLTSCGPHVVEFLVRSEKHLVQLSVDALFENGKTSALLSKEKTPGGRTSSKKAQSYKSLSDRIGGKQGRFRQNLLGKRVDYSGRSVITVGQKLKLNECGLPFEMAVELFQAFLIRHILDLSLAKTIRGAKNILKYNPSLTQNLLRNVMHSHPVLLNRAPTLHRLGIQAFQPKLIPGRALQLHPLVCSAFNADFDGDQMAVHLPLSAKARIEARLLMLATAHWFSPATGQPTLLPSQDAILGFYYLTLENTLSTKRNAQTAFKKVLGTLPALRTEEALSLYEKGFVDVHAPLWITQAPPGNEKDAEKNGHLKQMKKRDPVFIGGDTNTLAPPFRKTRGRIPLHFERSPLASPMGVLGFGRQTLIPFGSHESSPTKVKSFSAFSRKQSLLDTTDPKSRQKNPDEALIVRIQSQGRLTKIFSSYAWDENSFQERTHFKFRTTPGRILVNQFFSPNQ